MTATPVRLVVAGPGLSACEVEPAGDEVVVGRLRECGLRLPHPTVSHRHARLWREGEDWFVQDLGSTNGTRAGGRVLAPGTSRRLHAGEAVEIGAFRIALADTGEATGSIPTDALARRLARRALDARAPAGARLDVVAGPDAGARLDLDEDARAAWTVGRDPGCDLVLSDPDLSREHARVERAAAGFAVRDLGSRNGVRVDGRAVESLHPLRDGAGIEIGCTVLRLSDPAEAWLREIEREQAGAPAAPAAAGRSPAPAPAPRGIAFEIAAAVLGALALVVSLFVLFRVLRS